MKIPSNISGKRIVQIEIIPKFSRFNICFVYEDDTSRKAARKIADFCIEHEISTVVIGNVSKSQNGINLGRKTNQSFVNVSLGQFADKLACKLGSHGIKVVRANESYTSKASFADNDPMPEKYEPDIKHHFSGRRIKRGLYRTAEGILINADLNGAFNIIRKVFPEFNFQKLKDGIAGRFTPHWCAMQAHYYQLVSGSFKPERIQSCQFVIQAGSEKNSLHGDVKS